MDDDQADTYFEPPTVDPASKCVLRVALKNNLTGLQTPPLSAEYRRIPGPDPLVRLAHIDADLLDGFRKIIDTVVVYVGPGDQPAHSDHPPGDEYHVILDGQHRDLSVGIRTDTKQKPALSAAPVAAITVEQVEAELQRLAAAAATNP